VIPLLVLCPSLLCADAEQAVSAGELDEAISRVIARPEYSWRLPRERPVPEVEKPGILSAFWESVGEWLSAFWENVGEKLGDFFRMVWRALRRFLEWLEGLFDTEPRPRERTSLNWQSQVQGLLFVLLAVTASVLAVLLFRMWRRRRRSVTTVARPLAAPVDILAEDVTADSLPADEWMNMAREFLAKGEFRLAIRAMFLACLAHLAGREVITIAAHKSNRQYLGELERRARGEPAMLSAFTRNVAILEGVWYGRHTVTDESLDEFTENQERILRHDEQP